MSRIDDLILEHCPDGVRFLALADCAVTISGLSGKAKADFSNGNARFVSYKNAYANLAVDETSADFVKIAPGERQNRLHGGDVIFTGSSETADDVGMSSVVLAEPQTPLYLNSFCFALRFKDQNLVLPGFAKYLFRSESVRAHIRRSAAGVTRINVSKPRFMKIRIPIPPIEVQREIVRILDVFAELEAELEAELGAELEARRIQYVHLRTTLLKLPGEGARLAQMSDVLSLRAGKFMPAAEIRSEPSAEFPYPCFGGNGIRGYVAVSNQNGDCVLIGRQGAWSGNVHRATGKFYATEHAIVVTPREEISTSWLFHELTRMNLNQYVSAGAQPGLAVGNLNKVPMLVPTIAEQRRTADILDKLDALVNSLAVVLPAELVARRNQFVHYRDQLLTFKELAHE